MYGFFKKTISLLPRICDGDDELHELLYGDNPVPVPVRQAEDLAWDAAGGHDAVEGVGADRGVLERGRRF